MWLAAATSLLLRRFNKSVSSNSCRALFQHHHQTSFFINHHLHTTTTTTTTSNSSSSSKFGTFILQVTNQPYTQGIELYMLSSGSGSGSGSGDHGEDCNEEEDDQKKKMEFKLHDIGFSSFYKDYMLEDSFSMVGSCNGIICLHDPNAMYKSGRNGTIQHYTNLRDIYLWNPATRQCRLLPKSIPIEPVQEYGSFNEQLVAFGFDVKNNDYKVLRITSFMQKDARGWNRVDRAEGGCMCHVQVYSLSTDSWRLLEGIDSLPVIPSQGRLYQQQNSPGIGIYLNGSYFFVGRKRKYSKTDFTSMMFSFDFTKEIFTSIQLPKVDSSKHKMVLSCMGDKMAVFTVSPIDGSYDIWVLNEQHGSGSSGGGGGESWTKLHSFPIKRNHNRGERIYSQPLCISDNGEFALLSTTIEYCNEKLQLFNLVTKEVEKDFLLSNTRMCVYKESQVSIMGGGNVLLRWQLPTHGTTYKLNLDTYFADNDFVWGIGLCLISDTGGCIGVRSLKRYVNSDEEGEAQVMLDAIKWAIKLELSPIIIESNSKNVVSFFMEDDDDDDDDNNNSTYWSSGALSLLREAKLLLNSSEIGTNISFKYCCRRCNYVADIAAKLGWEAFWFCKEWTADSPGDIVSSLSRDLGLITERYTINGGEFD